jgi:triosephosphate isomerase
VRRREAANRGIERQVTGRLPMMAGNWKMNLNHLEAIALVQKLAFALPEKLFATLEVVVLPPFTDLRSVQTLVDGDRLLLGYGAQDVSAHAGGAYTGEISAGMLAKLGCQYVVVGHSERRQYHNETDEVVAAKVRAAYAADITPILCVGEPLPVRQAGDHVTHTLQQIDGALAGVPAEQARSLVVAYEPVWAIGTGEVATPEDAQEVCAAIRTRLAEIYTGDLADGVRILYGGSVKPDNIAGIMAEHDVDGALVGGASIDADAFTAICRYADQPS